MRRLVAAILRYVPCDARGRRAFDETLLDWEQEAAESRTVAGRIGVELLAMAGVMRAMAGLAARDVLAVPYLWLFSRVFLFGVLPATAIVLAVYPMWSWLNLAPSVVAEIRLMQVADEVESILPLAFFVAIAWPWRRRVVPAVGVALTAVLVTFTFVGWAEPASGRRSFDTTTKAWQAAYPEVAKAPVNYPEVRKAIESGWGPDRFRFGFPEQTRSIVEEARLRWQSGRLLGSFGFKLGLAPLAGAMALLAAGLTFRRASLRFAEIAVVIVGYVGGMALLNGHSLRREAILHAGTPDFNYDYLLGPSPFAGMAAVATVLLLGAAWILWSRGRWWRLFVPVACAALLWVSLPDDWFYLYRAIVPGLAPWVLTLVALGTYVQLLRRRPPAPADPVWAG